MGGQHRQSAGCAAPARPGTLVSRPGGASFTLRATSRPFSHAFPCNMQKKGTRCRSIPPADGVHAGPGCVQGVPGRVPPGSDRGVEGRRLPRGAIRPGVVSNGARRRSGGPCGVRAAVHGAGLGRGGAERRRAVGCAAGPRPGRYFSRKVKLPRHYIPSLWWFFLIFGRPGRTGRLAGTRRASPGFGWRGVGQRARRGLHLAGIDRKGVPVPWVLGARAGGAGDRRGYDEARPGRFVCLGGRI